MGIWFTRNFYIPCIKRADGTAMGVVKVRLVESMLPKEKRLFFDPYADNFLILASLVRWMGVENIINSWHRVIPGMYPMLAGRGRWLDDICYNAIKDHNCKQLIILGAGYDTRPIRLPELYDIPCFEIDQPELHALKSYGYDCLELTKKQREKLHLLAVDFNKESILKLAKHKDFQTNVKTVILLEGVSQYIPISTVATTLKHLKELVGSGSILGMTYVDDATYGNDIEIQNKICDDPTIVHKILKAVPTNEPWITGWSKENYKLFMESLSFDIIEDVSIEDFEDKYFTPLGRTAKPFLRIERFATGTLL